MKKKTLRTYFLDFKLRDQDRTLTRLQIDAIFNQLSLIPLDKTITQGSRVLELDQNVYYMILANDNQNIPSYQNCISGLFVRDRAFNYPYESNNNCALSELILNDEDDKIAEVTYFLIDKDLSVMLWISNRYVAGFSKLYNYINVLLDNAQSPNPRIEMTTLIRRDSISRFNSAEVIKSFVFKVTDSISTLIPRSQDTLAGVEEFQDLDLNNIVNSAEVKVAFKTDIDAYKKNAVIRVINDFRTAYQLRKSEAKVVIDDLTQDIDFLDDNFLMTKEIEVSERYTDYQQIFGILEVQLKDQRDFIRRTYRP